MHSDVSPERRAARRVALYARDADECRMLLDALGLLEYLVSGEDENSSAPPSMLTTPVHVPMYKIVSPNPRHA